MPPRVNSEGCYTDEGTVHDGTVRPYTPEEIERTRAHEDAHGIPSTLPAAEDIPAPTSDV